MPLKSRRRRTWGLPLVVVLACLTARPIAAAEEDQKEPPQEPVAETPDPYAVPDAPPAKLAEFVQRLLRTPPRDRETRQKAIAAMQEAADKILAAEPDTDAARTALQVKMMFAASANELRPLIKRVEQHFTEGPVNVADAVLAIRAGRAAEMLGDAKLAVATYTSFSKLLAANKDPDVAAISEKLEAVVRRLTLIGSEMKVEGTTLAGQPLDWPKFRGKVVLVDFWATWCGPCVGEVPNMLETYETYRDRGFEIVGISLDRDRERLEKFIEEKEIPWTIVHNDDGSAPTANYYGVMAIPTMVLVGADGKVVSTKARGEELRSALEKLLGPAEEDKGGEGGE